MSNKFLYGLILSITIILMAGGYSSWPFSVFMSPDFVLASFQVEYSSASIGIDMGKNCFNWQVVVLGITLANLADLFTKWSCRSKVIVLRRLCSYHRIVALGRKPKLLA